MREFDPKYPEGIDADFNEKQRQREDAQERLRWWRLAREARDDAFYVDAADYDPNTLAEDAYERDCESRLARERARQDEATGLVVGGIGGDTTSAPDGLSAGLSAALVELHQTIDHLEAGLLKVERFLGIVE